MLRAEQEAVRDGKGNTLFGGARNAAYVNKYGARP